MFLTTDSYLNSYMGEKLLLEIFHLILPVHKQPAARK